jgi:hypothetical protein
MHRTGHGPSPFGDWIAANTDTARSARPTTAFEPTCKSRSPFPLRLGPTPRQEPYITIRERSKASARWRMGAAGFEPATSRV